MVNIPVNKPTARKPDAKRRDTLVKRIVSDFGRGLQSVALGGKGGNAVAVDEARAIGRLFVAKGYFASLVYDIAGNFERLVVSKTRNIATAEAKPVATGKAESGASEPVEVEVEPVEVEDGEEPEASVVEPDVFNYNGESVVAASDPDRPYALYRRAYPHKPKWIVADASHRVVCLCLWRSHAQSVVDELNALAEKK